MDKVEVVLDCIKVGLMDYQKVAILKEKGGEQYLPIWIGSAEAASLSERLKGTPMPRPQTYDFVWEIIQASGATVKSAIISELKNDTFYARITLDVNGKQKEIDCRPSDALLLIAGTTIPIFVRKEVWELGGLKIRE